MHAALEAAIQGHHAVQQQSSNTCHRCRHQQHMHDHNACEHAALMLPHTVLSGTIAGLCRWLNKEGRSSQMGSWLPFSAGPRMCIGYSFALQEIKVQCCLQCGHAFNFLLTLRFAFAYFPLDSIRQTGVNGE